MNRGREIVLDPGYRGRQRQHLQQLIEAVPDAVVVLGNSAVIGMVNHHTETMFGYSRAQLVEQPVSKLLPARFRPRHEGLVAGYFASPRTRHLESGLELVAERSGGQEFPVAISLAPLVLDDEQRYVISAIRDMSDRKRMEAALGDVERMKDEFISSLAHELRTPMAALRGFVDTLLLQISKGNGPSLAAWQTDILSEISQATDRLQLLSAGLLDASRIHAGLLEVRREPHDLAALVRRIATHVQHTARSHKVRVRARPEPVVVNVDVARIEQVLVHLLANAVTYSPDGGLIAVTLSTNVSRQQVRLQVRDQGIGIPESLQRSLFTPFGSMETSVSLGGLGLGLYLSREIVKRHGGEMGVTSSLGKGSAFWLTLPLPGVENVSAD